MNTKEGQPSGVNPEWENNREQNIAIAKRVNDLLLSLPSLPLLFKSMEEMGIPMEGEGFKRYLDSLKSIDPTNKGFTQAETLKDLAFLVAKEELTIGYSIPLTHVDNEWRHIYLKLGWNREFTDFVYRADLELFPENFKFPVYGIQIGTNNIYDDTAAGASSIYGESQNDIIGDDGLYYRITNTYCFNFFGQGAKIEDISQIGPLGEWFDEAEARHAERKFPRVNFVPQKEDSRVVSLAPEDYEKINKIFADIDAGLYKA